MDRIISRADAQLAGLRYFFTGEPCKRGHVFPRKVSDGGCVECRRLAIQAKKPNKPLSPRQEAIRLGLAHYVLDRPCKHGHIAPRSVKDGTCGTCAMLQSRRFRAEYPEKERAKNRKWKAQNKEKRLEQDRAWKRANPERDKAKCRKWRKANLERLRVLENRRRSRKMNAEGCHTKEDIALILESQKGLCAGPGCRKPLNGKYQVDHIVPISKGGSNWPSNLQCLCISCNPSKGNKSMDSWIAHKGWAIEGLPSQQKESLHDRS